MPKCQELSKAPERGEREREKVGMFRIQKWLPACATDYEGVAEPQNSEATTIFLPTQHPYHQDSLFS